MNIHQQQQQQQQICAELTSGRPTADAVSMEIIIIDPMETTHFRSARFAKLCSGPKTLHKEHTTVEADRRFIISSEKADETVGLWEDTNAET